MNILKFPSNYDSKNEFCMGTVTQERICTVWLMLFSPYPHFTIHGIKGSQKSPCLPDKDTLSELADHFSNSPDKFLVTEWGGELWFALPMIYPISAEVVLLRLDPEIDRQTLFGHLKQVVPSELYSVSKCIDMKNIPIISEEDTDSRIFSFLKYISYIVFGIQSFSKIPAIDHEFCIMNCIKGIMRTVGCAGKVTCTSGIGSSYSNTDIHALYAFLFPMLMTISTSAKCRCADVYLSSLHSSVNITLSVAHGDALDIMSMYSDMEEIFGEKNMSCKTLNTQNGTTVRISLLTSGPFAHRFGIRQRRGRRCRCHMRKRNSQRKHTKKSI